MHQLQKYLTGEIDQKTMVNNADLWDRKIFPKDRFPEYFNSIAPETGSSKFNDLETLKMKTNWMNVRMFDQLEPLILSTSVEAKFGMDALRNCVSNLLR